MISNEPYDLMKRINTGFDNEFKERFCKNELENSNEDVEDIKEQFIDDFCNFH
ncbi:hypothetical protein [Clostridium ganghwense]|uniref:Uncharacterized protein n=1 Tax=Clostridium ganghwense TaxID=312089 RepID=A0ABT4CU55_9CLOT|nr:hypothetical protein [Clostridium ganghwense]MCY6372608.1 hypothetical protein [Clostridium ganghwense]